ncbi:hypothetical protein BCR42DRAFT_402777 [Absidia repens]|uniref:Uncharacterized protein n=1 Tax=Absidia repens TaxID=90262 RepID=A0A1X2J063_9FUNG|nr:hypothetical protein BCR42DRAFT_402777 [Absidia repens]
MLGMVPTNYWRSSPTCTKQDLVDVVVVLSPPFFTYYFKIVHFIDIKMINIATRLPLDP